jgi:1-phosphofructokinase
MITTLTANPSVDRTLRITRLRPGSVHRVGSVVVEPSGKGVNVARALAANGHPVTAVLPIGGTEGARLAALLREEGLAFVSVPVAASTRCNVTLLEAGGVATKFNEPGPHLSASEVSALLDVTENVAVPGGWTVCCGSLPPGVPDDFYARIVTRVRANQGRVAVDTTGPALLLAAAAGADLLKPNLEELAQATGRRLAHLGDVVEAANDLRNLGATTVLVSLGPDGAILVGPDATDGMPTVHHGETGPITLVSPVGAGDALLAGFLAATPTGLNSADVARHGRLDDSLHDQPGDAVRALRTALAFAAACCASPTCEVPAVAPEAMARMVVHATPDFTRPLSKPS